MNFETDFDLQLKEDELKQDKASFKESNLQKVPKQKFTLLKNIPNENKK